MSKPNLRIKFGDKSVPVLDKEAKVKQQIERAKKNGLAEMEQFTIAYEKFHKEVKDLALYQEAVRQIEHAVDSLTDNVLKPVLLGEEVYGVPEHIYNNLRLDIFKSLIEKYEGEDK